MAQVNLDVVYNVKGMQALKQSQAAMNQAAMAAKGSTNSVRGYSQALTTNAAAATKSGAANTVAAKGYRATGFAAVGATGGVKGFGVALSAALGPIAAITGGLALVGKAINVFSERERDVAVLTNGLKNLGLQGTPALDALQQSADKLGKTTLFDQEQFTRGYALLTSFKQIGVSSYERVAKAASDLAQTTGQDLNSALLQLSKALEDPARRVTDLSRSGTVFTEQQKEQIRVLQESGDILGAQAIILEEIEKQYGGAAEAAGSAGFAGAMDSLGEATRDLMEQLGQNLIPILTGVVKVISSLIGFVNTLIGKLNELGLNKVFELLMKPAEIFAGLMGDAAEEVDKTRQNAEAAAPAVSDLKDQVLEMPKPVKETADNMEKVAKSTGNADSNAKQLTKTAQQTDAEYDSIMKNSAGVAENIKLQKQLQEEQNQAVSEGVQKTAGLVAQNEKAGAAASNIAREMMTTNSMIQQSTASANQLTGALQSAASAASGISSAMGGGGSGGLSFKNNTTMNAKYKLDENGNIVQRTQGERAADAKRQKLNEMNRMAWDAEVFDRTVAPTTTEIDSIWRAGYRGQAATWGPVGSKLYTQMNQTFGGLTGPYGIRKGSTPNSIADALNNPDQSFNWYADGGYVTGPQQAVVGEGGEPEYIIPASKMDSAMQRYGSGMRGSSVIPDNANVSINYNGSTVDMGGTSYINKGDVNGIVSQAVNATLTTLKKSPRARLEAGMR